MVLKSVQIRQHVQPNAPTVQKLDLVFSCFSQSDKEEDETTAGADADAYVTLSTGCFIAGADATGVE